MKIEDRINFIMSMATFTDDKYYLDGFKRGLEVAYRDIYFKTCGNCKHCVGYEKMNFFECNLLSFENNMGRLEYIEVKEDFGCFKWEAKDKE
jgi:hypothetical protein